MVIAYPINVGLCLAIAVLKPSPSLDHGGGSHLLNFKKQSFMHQLRMRIELIGNEISDKYRSAQTAMQQG